jgi:GNAT superfamily N-acetyltransferase
MSVMFPKGIRISSDKKSVAPEEAAALYIELGWGTVKDYTAKRMKRSLLNCDIVVSARNGADELVGIARALTDHATETKILDMIIAPEYQRQGVGKQMMREIEQLCRGTAIYLETERKNFPFVEKLKYKKRKGLTVFVKKN